METLSFETIIFNDCKDYVEGLFLNIFSFRISKEILLSIGDFSVSSNSISFDAENAREKFNAVLDEALLNLTNIVTKKKTVYVHRNSGIPLIGSIAFGLIDRGTNIVEVRPISGCNIKCVYCSVDEDKRIVDFVVDADYLVDELRKLVEFKRINNIEAHIASQGEPTMYADLPRLIEGIKKIQQVKTISIDTNGILLTKSKIDELLKAGLNRINFSINAIDDKIAKNIAAVGDGYNIQKVLDTAEYLSDKVELIIAPVYVQGWNDDELEKIVEFTKSLKNEKFEPKCFI
ncbi:radical SAM protein [Candidatus Woesearchaeota archaeon]|nr:radical SAM protein [Candidatus Woesearchaeota archaeon]